MATVCEYCGHKTNEVKSGGGIEPKGKKIILRVTDVSDMSRDVLKVKRDNIKWLIVIFLFILCWWKESKNGLIWPKYQKSRFSNVHESRCPQGKKSQ